MSKELDEVLECLERLDSVDFSEFNSNLSNDYPEWFNPIKQFLLKAKEQEEELGCSIADLLNGLKSKQAALRYFDKYEAIHCHCKEGWYVNMIMYGWIPLKDFIKGLNNKEEK